MLLNQHCIEFREEAGSRSLLSAGTQPPGPHRGGKSSHSRSTSNPAAATQSTCSGGGHLWVTFHVPEKSGIRGLSCLFNSVVRSLAGCLVYCRGRCYVEITPHALNKETSPDSFLQRHIAQPGSSYGTLLAFPSEVFMSSKPKTT